MTPSWNILTSCWSWRRTGHDHRKGMGLCRSGRARPRSTTCSMTRPTTPVADTLGGNRPCTPRNRTPRSGGRTNGWLLHPRRSRRTPGRRTRCPGSTSRLAPIGNTLRDLKEGKKRFRRAHCCRTEKACSSETLIISEVQGDHGGLRPGLG